MSIYAGGGDISKGGFMVHYRHESNICQWAFVTSVVDGTTVNLKVIPNDPDQFVWRPKVKHGAGKGEWHYDNQCKMDAAQMREDDTKHK